MVSGSQCHWGINELRCLPRPNRVFEYWSLERGFTHSFDLRAPWHVYQGVVGVYLPIIVGCISTAALAFWGQLTAARTMLSLCFLVPGIMELINAIALATSPRSPSSHILHLDSFYWWPLALNTIWISVVIMLMERHVMNTLPLQFVINFISLNIHNIEILGNETLGVPFSATFLLGVWLIFRILQQQE